MAIRTIAELDVEERRVFVRVDFDVPLTPARGIADGRRVQLALPTIRQLLGRGARVVLAASLGKPRGRPNPELSLEPVGAYLAEQLGQEVVLTDEPTGDGARKVVSDLRAGSVALLENLQFSAGEEANDERFARALAGYADVYVNESFATAHLAHASTAGLPRNVADRAIGPLFGQELRQLGQLRGEVERPFIAIVGGATVGPRMALLEYLLPRVDAIYFGGAVANTFLKARGGALGRSLLDEDKLSQARSLLTRAQHREVQMVLPRDLVAAAGTRAAVGRVVAAGRVPDDLAALDIGPETARAFHEGIVGARTVLWTGPMGVHESEHFMGGTLAVARAVGGTRGAFTVITGDDTTAAVHRAGMAERISHISLGGEATLEYLEGHRLPALAALET